MKQQAGLIPFQWFTSSKQLAVLIVLLNATICAEAAVRTWDGGGSNNRWMTAANWQGDQLPNAGDDLLFPAGVARAASFNDFPDGTGFRTITVLSNSYQFTGAGITLSGGITASCGTNPSQVSVWLPITLVAPQIFSVQSGLNTTLSFHGRIDTQVHDLTFAASGWISLIGELAGGGRITKIGLATLTFDWGTNTYWGVTHVQQGVLRIYNGYGLGNASAETIVEAGAELEYSNASVPVREPLVLRGSLYIAGANHWAGPISLPGSGARIRSGANCAIDGVISGPGGLLLIGGPISLNADNTYQGLSEFYGSVTINGPQGESDLLFGGTYLSGRGGVGNLTTTGGVARTIAVGDNGVGVFTAARGVTLDSYTTLSVALEGAPNGTANFLDVRGSVNLANAKLQVWFRTPPTQMGQQFLILRNDGTDSITGTFASLPEGALLLSAEGSITLRITYRGFNNDVVLQIVAPPTSTWDGGGGADNRWTTAANWAGDIAPQPGNAILFPQMSVGSTNFNDFPAGTTFQEITVNSDVAIQGNLIALNAGVNLLDQFGLLERIELALPIRLNSPQRFHVDDETSSARISGDIYTAGHTLTLAVEEELEVLGSISGAGGLIVSNRGTTLLMQANTYSGLTEVHDGILVVGHPFALGTTNAGTIVAATGELWLGTSNSVSEPLTLIGRLSSSLGIYDGPIEARGGIIDGNIEINGVIPGAVTIEGGTVTLSGDSPYSGEVTLKTGTLFVNGNQPSNNVVIERSKLGGVGRVGRVSSGTAPYAMQLAPGINGPGVLTMGDLTLHSAAEVILELNGSTNDQLRVIGKVRLDHPTLTVTRGFTPAIGESFVIIANDGTDPVEGSFLYLQEGMIILVFGYQMQITYVGGDGNDVALKVVSEIPSVRMWVGGGTDPFWTTAANWLGDILPQPGDALGFPVAASRKTNINDFPAHTTFDSITFTAPGYNISGQPLSLDRGVAAAFDADPQLSLPIRLNSNQTFSASGPLTRLTIRGHVDTAGRSLSFTGPGSIDALGEISGAGSVAKRGSGPAVLFGTNTYLGVSEILEGTVTINNPAALGTTQQPTIVAAGATLIAQNPYSFPEPIVLAGKLASDGRWTGPIETVSASAELAGSFDGVISGTGGISVKSTVTLTGNNTYAGPTLIPFGMLTIIGQQPQSPVRVTGGTLSGTGEAGPVTALDGAVTGSPLTTRDLALHAPARLQIVALSSSNDQVRVHGSVTLNQPELRLFTFFYQGLPLGRPMTIIDNDGADPVAGTFAGFPEGTAKRLGTNGQYHITYVGGDGNDVVITRVRSEAATILSLTIVGETVQIKARGTPTGYYNFERATNLNPIVEWTFVDSRFANADGIVSLTDYPFQTNGTRFYRLRSSDF